ncbi:ABC transporter permease [Caldilinea sp.]|uniref:ABC transporter permease n=1 Tax=Caldilinea sp. TaxID=2293560 RepID=UPI0025804FDF|nr:ABC transporter permease [Caldilinea sp.]
MSLEVVLQSIFSAAFIATVIRVATPLILPAMGGLLSELGGVINIALEGIMLAAAFTGVIVSGFAPQWFPGAPAWSYAWLGALAGVLVGMAMGWLIAFFHLELKTDIILTGLAMNILASGATVFLMFSFTGDKGSTSTLASARLPSLQIPFVNNIPVLGTLLNGENGTGYNVMSYLAFVLVAVIGVFLYRMPAGAHLRATGEMPDAAQSVGIDIRRVRYQALVASGFCAALGGLYLSMGYLSIFQANMTAGRGFIALAVIYLGNRNPVGTLIAALIFGAASALGTRLGTMAIPPQIVEMIPPAVTIAALIIYNIRRRAQINAAARRFQEQVEVGSVTPVSSS